MKPTPTFAPLAATSSAAAKPVSKRVRLSMQSNGEVARQVLQAEILHSQPKYGLPPRFGKLYECKPLTVWDVVIALVFVALVLVWFGGLL